MPETCLVLVDLMCRVPAGMYRGLVANLMYRGIYRVPGFSTSPFLVTKLDLRGPEIKIIGATEPWIRTRLILADLFKSSLSSFLVS